MDTEKKAALLFEISLLSAAIFLGTNPVAVKYAVADIPPLPFVAIRFIVAGVLLLIFLRLLKQGGGLAGKDFLAMAGVGLVGVGLNNILFTLGVSLTTASDTALIYATPPLWGMLLGFLLGLEHPKWFGVLGLGIALVGVVVVVYGGLGETGTTLPGVLLVLGAAFCWGSYSVLALPLLRKHSPLVVAAYTMLFGGLSALPLASLGFVTTEWAAVNMGAWIAMAYSTLFVAAFGFFAWQRGVSRIGANRVLVYQYLVTLTGVSAGVALLGENLTANKLVGGAVILVGVYLARRQ